MYLSAEPRDEIRLTSGREDPALSLIRERQFTFGVSWGHYPQIDSVVLKLGADPEAVERLAKSLLAASVNLSRMAADALAADHEAAAFAEWQKSRMSSEDAQDAPLNADGLPDVPKAAA